jgi:outer membrane protein assembly factor BamB
MSIPCQAAVLAMLSFAVEIRYPLWDTVAARLEEVTRNQPKDITMRRQGIAVILGLLLLGTAALNAVSASTDSNWPTWRGPSANGVAATQGNPPITWSESENIKWKVKVPGTGSSTPVVWGNKMFFQTAVPTVEQAPPDDPQPHRSIPATVPYRFNVVCLDRRTGALLWERTVREEIPHEGHHPSGTLASYSPVTDGEQVWASFGSRGLHCFDLDGNKKWSVDLVKMTTRRHFGEGSSPALAGDAIVVVMDHEGDSKIAAFNKDTGALLWEQKRDEVTAWATPLVVDVAGEAQVVTAATSLIRSYDAATGDLIWQCAGLTTNVIPTPVTAFGNVYCMSGYRGYALLAIKLGQTGDLTGSDAIAWQIDKGTPYVASPLLYGNRIYFTAERRAKLSCYDAQTGKPLFTNQQLEGMNTIYASPVGAADRVYIADRDGTTTVINAADKLEVLAVNTLNDGFDASPIILGDELYLKGKTHLYCIAKQ